jgi:D-psicose/D-tagatose/L-ribulose 3-epimerase
MSIKIGVNAWIWTSPFNTSDPESLNLLDKAKAMGFDSFEFGLESVSDVDPIKLKERAQATGLRLVICGAFGPDRDLTHEDPAIRANSLDYITKALEICAKSGCPTLAGPSYSAVGKRRHVSAEQKKVEWDLAVKGLKEAAKRAANLGVRIAVEPLNRFETDLLNTSEQCERLLNDIGEKNVGFHLDTFHMNIEEKDTYEAIKRAKGRLFHFHTCENDRGTPGSGKNIDWEGTAKALKEIGYDGDAVIESFTPKTKSIAGAAAIWRTLAPTQDSLASEGLAFLRKAFA